jgi:cell division protease FtsH
MSAPNGMMAVGEREQDIYHGREFARRTEISEHTAQVVDEEVKALLDAAFERARSILSDKRELLDRVAQALLDRETIDAEEVMMLLRGRTLPPRAADAPPLMHDPGATRSEVPPAPRAPILGVPPAEPAGA